MNLCIQPMIPHWGGLPHSDIHGSTPARGSPWLIAACHVLHRLLVPRHPPNALLLLNHPGHSPSNDQASPAMHRNHPRPKRRHGRSPSHSKPRSAHNSSTPLNAAATRPLSTRPAPARGQARSLGQTRHGRIATDAPCRPRTRRDAPGREAAEVSYAPRDAPEPDSHEQRTGAPAHRRERP